ncbi:hypothetical protein [Streptomyces racemochromogenes]|uniref:hypothetical protein n=1 Tax=Streptomyces racemochromogenes TaxID=67353 RepID=UPI0035E6039E
MANSQNAAAPRPTPGACPRAVLSLDTPDGQTWGVRTIDEPSAELLSRAFAGWQRFTNSSREPSDV